MTPGHVAFEARYAHRAARYHTPAATIAARWDELSDGDRADWETAVADLAAERDEARAVVADILSRFGPSGSGHTARVGQVQIAKWRAQAGLEGDPR